MAAIPQRTWALGIVRKYFDKKDGRAKLRVPGIKHILIACPGTLVFPFSQLTHSDICDNCFQHFKL